MNKPHIHAELIKAWADGAQIQYLDNYTNTWFDSKNNKPEWLTSIKYRIKPEPSDLEIYGVEVGDIWIYPDKNDIYIIRAVLGKVPVKAQTINIQAYVAALKNTVNLDTYLNLQHQLIFRRGVVNKL